MELNVEVIRSQLIELPKCCGEYMFKYEQQPQMNMNVSDGVMWVCLKCGGYFQMTDGQLDEDELDNYKEMAKDE